MGTKKGASSPGGLAGALFTPVQRRVLGLLFGQPERSFGSAELIRRAGSGTGAVHRQLMRLERAGLVRATRVGNQKHYQADPGSPVFVELHGLVVKTVGLVEPLRAALASLEKKIAFAFVFGSVARGTERGGSDIDLFVVSDELSFPDLYEALRSAEEALARTIQPTVVTRAEWRRKRSGKDSFVKRIAAQPKLVVLGSEDAAA
jgi:predicted nucleotidyltransferase